MIDAGGHLRSTYVTGWIRRGPVGLIGHTKGDANETVANLLADHAEGRLSEPAAPAPEAVESFLAERSVRYDVGGLAPAGRGREGPR